MPNHQPERPHDPEHDHVHSQLSEVELRVRALESVLTQKGYIEPAALDLLIETYEEKIGPHNGARVVAKAWVDEEFKRRLLAEPTPVIASLGYAGFQGEHMVVVENTPLNPAAPALAHGTSYQCGRTHNERSSEHGLSAHKYCDRPEDLHY